MKFTISSIIFISMLFFPFCGYTKQNTDSLLLTCQEMSYADTNAGEADGFIVSTIIVKFQENGLISSVEISRKADDEFGPLIQKYEAKNMSIQHQMIANPVDENGDSTNMFGIAEVENIIVVEGTKEVFRLRVNDHSYAGSPGSSVMYSKNDSTLDTSETGNTVDCSGRVKKPWNTGLDDIE